MAMTSLLRPLARALLRLLFRVSVRGHLEPGGRMLIVSNHQSFLDGILLGAFLPVMPVWFIHTAHARRWFLRLPLHFLPHLTVDQMNPWALKAAIALIEAGQPLLIFPEGRVTETGTLMKIYDGPAFVAAKTGARVVPVRIEGAVYSRFSRMHGDFPKRLFPRISITIHAARAIAMPEARTARLRRHLAAEVLRRIMQEAAVAVRPETTLFAAFLDAVALHGRGRRVLEDVEHRQSYGSLLKAALALGRITAKLSREGEFVGVLMPNVRTAVALLLGMAAMRRVPAILNYTAGAEGMQNACRLAGVRVVLTSREFLEKARLTEAAAKLGGVRLVCLEDLRASFGWRDKLWLMGWALWFPRRAALRSRAEDPAAILFTSGSEGLPKGVALSHANILANVAQIKATMEFAPKDRYLSALPMFHAFGLVVGVILPLLSGTYVLLYPSPLHYRLIPEILYDRNCTVLFATGTFLGHYARAAHPYDLRCIRLVVAGAEKLAEEVRRTYAEKFGLRVLEGYGATECSPVIAVNSQMSSKPGTAGELLPLMEHRLEPVPGLAEGGILHVRGPNVMLGYLRPDGSGAVEPPRSVFGEGWYNTGDIVSIDEAGFLAIQGRARRFAKVAGEMVSLELVERIAAAASPGHDHAAAAAPEPGRGESIVLFTLDAALERGQVQQAARKLGAPDIALPRRIVPCGKLPLLGNGKKDYVALTRMACELTARRVGGG